MVRVLHCVVSMNYGGYETFIMNVYRNIDRSKVQFDFLTNMHGVFDEEIENLGGKIYRIPFITKVGPFIYKYYLDKFFKEHPDYTIVHSHMDKFSGCILKSAKKYGVKTRIAHSHSAQNEGNFLYHMVKDYYGTMVNPNCTDKFACSREAADWMYGPGASDAVIVYNGIEIEKYLPSKSVREAVRKQLGVNSCYVLGHVGRFLPIKNHTFIIDVFSEVKALKGNAKLLLVGAGPTEDKIKEKVRSLHLENDVIFYGTSDKVNELMQAMDAFILPSENEGLGIVLIEAQAAGLYCTVSDTVPKRTKITDNIQFISLKKGADVWASKILDSNPMPASSERLINCDYNISKTAEFLQSFYINKA